MDQIRIGSFLKELRKEQNLTQEDLAQKLGVSNRTISRWETGNNMPDIGMLVEIAELYDVSIPEIIDGERKSESMNQETKETAVKLAEYSRNEAKTSRQKVTGTMLTVFGLFIIMSALAIFPNDSSWGCNYSLLGSIFVLTGIWLLSKQWFVRKLPRILTAAGCALLLFGTFAVTDYLTVTKFHQVPRFTYLKGGTDPDEIIYKTLFFTVVQKYPGTDREEVYILK